MAFPASALPVVVQAWLGSTLGWVAVPVRTEAGGGGVKIKRDRKPGAALPDPGSCTLVVDNTSGDWSPRNPRGAYFGLLGRNTPVRVSFDGGSSWRFVGEVSSWAPRWSTSGSDRYVPVTASGILRRLFAGNAPARSPMRRAFTASAPVAYWPLEDGADASQAGAALAGHQAAQVDGVAEFVEVAEYAWGTAGASATQPVRYGTGKVLDLRDGASVRATLPPDATAATGSAWTVSVTGRPDHPTTSGDVVLLQVDTPGGTYVRWQLIQREGATFGYEAVAINAAGASTSVAVESGLYRMLYQWNLSVWQDGPTIRVGVDTNDSGSFFATGSVAGTLTGVAAVSVNPTGVTATDSMPFGHLAVWAAPTLPAALIPTGYDADGQLFYGPYLSHRRERATDRLARLCGEEGVPLDMPAVADVDDARMGWQPAGTFAELVAQCVDVDGGLLLEARDALGLVYRPRATLYNTAAAVTLDYAAGHIAPPFEPVDDDDQVANDVTVERVEGASVRATLTTGPLSVNMPPDGVGPYEQQVTLNLLDDGQLADRAGWLLHMGTVDAARYEQVAVQLDGAALAADAARSAAAAGVDAGDLVELVGLPDWLPPGPELAMVYGYEETADAYAWRIAWTAGPGAVWTVATVDGAARLAADGTTLAAPLSAGATSASIVSTASNGRWTTAPADFPLDMMIGGELVTASTITGAGLTQTVTLSARAVNGVTRAWPAGARVDVATPAVLAL